MNLNVSSIIKLFYVNIVLNLKAIINEADYCNSIIFLVFFFTFFVHYTSDLLIKSFKNILDY